MSKIHLLPEQLINQIAAGEVVERPASIVKEMLENSIDAGAKKIVVEISNNIGQGGLQKIKMTDDGCGMSVEDARLALQRHATSKIYNWEDLLAVQTMGFRGEALASIASVSKLTLRTRQAEDQSGTEIYLEGGKILKESPIGMAVGTEIEVAEIFYNTPARYKFMKAEKTEYQNMVEIVLNAALSWPEVAFKLINSTDTEAKIALDLPATNDALTRIRGALGKAVSDEMIPVFYGGVNLKISGFIGKPSLSRSNRSMQYFFVNNRAINSYVLVYAVKQSFHSLLPKERNPVFVINFELDPTMVDVNCHPRKTEVKFRDEREVYRVLTMACSKALEAAVLMPKFSQANLNYYQQRGPANLGSGMATMEFQSLESRETVSVKVAEAPSEQPSQDWTGQEMTEPENLEMQVIGQLDDSFILCQRESDLVLIDQHAAHERIRYNKLMAEGEKEEMVIQPLLMPINIELSPADRAVLDANKTELDAVGLKLEHFGGNTFAISEVPSFLTKTNLEKLLIGLIDDLRNTDGDMRGHKGDLYSRKEKILTYMACRSAVKFGDALSREEMVALVEELAQTTFGRATCPHGRPIMIVLESTELWSRFGRKYSGITEQEKFGGVNC